MSHPALRASAAALVSASLVLAPLSSASAWTNGGSGGTSHGPNCHDGSINIFKPVVINKNINVFKPVVIDKNINIVKNVNINKNININKVIVISKASAVAEAEAQALASASANSSAAGNVIVYGGSSYENVTVNAHGGEVGQVTAQSRCEVQDATIVKAIHAVCVSEDGREFPASHMLSDTWIDESYEGEVARCIPGSRLKITIGDVEQSDQGMASGYVTGEVMSCADHEALRHFKDGMLKCAPAVSVPDCTERTNLRRYGSGDFFFTYRAKACLPVASMASHEADLSGMSLEGGVGPNY
jgi:hypothetical protein